MTDHDLHAFIREALGEISSDQRELREGMRDLAENIADVAASSGRIEEQMSSMSTRLNDLRKDHDLTVARISKTEEAMYRRISGIEKQAAWVKAWSAGAVGAILAVLGAVGWVAAHLPVIEDVASKVSK